MGEAKAWLLDRRDRMAVSVWLISRLLVLAISWLAALWLVDGDLQDPFLDRWTQWDVDHFLEIAQYGYGGDPAQPVDPGLPAFFPGFPLLVKAVHVVIPDWRLAAMLISVAAGAVAMVALARLGDLQYAGVRRGDRPAGGTDHGPDHGPHAEPHVEPEAWRARSSAGLWAVIALSLSPMAVFLFAGYSETLFLAFALPAWICARKGRWAAAALCAGVAGSIRITGLFLAVALIVEFLTGPNGLRARRLRSALWLPVAFAGPVAYAGYLWWWSGDPQAWQHAQEKGWGRGMVAPWEAFKTTWSAAFETHNDFTGAFQAELLAALAGVLLLLWLLVRRAWAESTYVGLQLVALLTSSFYLSIGRATLLWWPLWIAIGALAVRRSWLGVPLIALGVPFMVSQIVTYNAGHWTG